MLALLMLTAALLSFVDCVRALEAQGHRGARGLWPENTLAGFAGALGVGVDVLELDTGLSRDGVVVVAHDSRLNPALTRDADGAWLTSSGPPLRQLTFAGLQQFDVGRALPGSGLARRFPYQRTADGAKIPHLQQVFYLVERAGAVSVRFNVEIKIRPDRSSVFATPEVAALAVIEAIRRARVEARTTIQGFDWRALRAARKLAPNIATAALSAQQSWFDNIEADRIGVSAWTDGYDVDDYSGSVPHLVHASGANIWSPFWRDVNARSIAQAHALGLKVSVWTVNDPRDMQSMLRLGVDSIITDYPDRLRAVLIGRGLRVPRKYVEK